LRVPAPGYRAGMEHSANIHQTATSAAGSPACRIVRGVVRLLASLDYRLLTEFALPDGRRADIAAIDPRGGFAIVEVKSSVADFRADAKWGLYRSYCDVFFFAVDPAFPRELLPDDVGVIVADAFQAARLRPAPLTLLNAARRRALMLRFARTAAARLAALTDSAVGQARSGW
jgi:hypothetical protein